jgi:hypothetical protein
VGGQWAKTSALNALLGMTAMTGGLKALARSARQAAATLLRGAICGALVTHLAQPSNATTMTTIGPISAGLLCLDADASTGSLSSIDVAAMSWLDQTRCTSRHECRFSALTKRSGRPHSRVSLTLRCAIT